MNVIEVESVSSESVYELILDGEWATVLDFIHSDWKDHASDAQFGHLVDTFVKAFMDTLPDRGDSEAVFLNQDQAEMAERILLFQLSGQFKIKQSLFRELVLRLVDHFSETPSKALSLAQFLPEEPACASIIQTYGRPKIRRIRGTEASNVSVVGEKQRSETSRTPALFRSEQEIRFFEAMTDVFSHHLVYPNVAIQSVVAFESIEIDLSSREREYYFRSLIDCVLFDSAADYRAVAAFELDSPLHDDARREEKDRMKDRILARAGVPLIRVRPHQAQMTKNEFVELLKNMRESNQISELT